MSAPVGTALSNSYREFDVKRGTPEYLAWEDWFKIHNFPVCQVPYKGWAARDAVRCTVSALVFYWKPSDAPKLAFGSTAATTIAYPDKTDDGQYSGSKDARFAVYTVQLEAAPLPFPEVE
ncbi:MAG: hypothetical protein JWO67_3820 [Streptosporangiaceae bacterium]|nr:hypothetical protein [Streptosporangiaceae bacterium]